MNLFPVYPLFDIEPIQARGSYVYGKDGQQYLDLYGGHAVISIGHCHEHQVDLLKQQLDKIMFYSNSVVNSMQEDLAVQLKRLSDYPEHSLFLCNSGAEANDHALKLAAFHTGRSKILAFNKAFHGRTGTTLPVTSNPKISSPLNSREHVAHIDLNDAVALEEALKTEEFAAVIIEPIQGVAGLYMPTNEFLVKLRALCDEYGTVLIMDEVQSGFGRSGKFFAHQYAGIEADIIPMAKGMGNGFPIGGLLISPKIEAWYGMLGTTFGGNHLACAACKAVLDVIEEEDLLKNATEVGEYAKSLFLEVPGVQEVRGEGLMLGMVFDFPIAEMRKRLVFEEFVFTGSSADPNTIRILPPLNISKEQILTFVNKLKNVLPVK